MTAPRDHRADTSLTDPFAFEECDTCAQRTGTPLCLGCQHNQAVICQLRAEHAALVEVYAVAACLRSFPVPLDRHLELVDVVDTCRHVLEPPLDYDVQPEEEMLAKKPELDPPVNDAREEFLATYRSAHEVFHKLWSEAIGQEGYEKAPWRLLNNALERFARDASEKFGIPRSKPLL